MKVYFVNTTKEIVKRHADVGVKNFLVSYWYEKQSGIIDAIKKIEPEADILLDSGAFTAFTHKEKINIDEYIQFALDHRDKVNHIVALDDLTSSQATKENYQKFLDAGIKDAIPTFHVGEDWEYLKYYCKKTKYIALGGSVQLKLKVRNLTNWISQAIEMIPKDKEIHLFGVNNYQIMLRFAERIESVDSSGSATRFNSLRVLSASGIPVSMSVDTTKGRMSIKHIQASQYYTIFRMLQMEEEINEFIKLKRSG